MQHGENKMNSNTEMQTNHQVLPSIASNEDKIVAVMLGIALSTDSPGAVIAQSEVLGTTVGFMDIENIPEPQVKKYVLTTLTLHPDKKVFLWLLKSQDKEVYEISGRSLSKKACEKELETLRLKYNS